jgi:hypothetical protein
MLETWHCLVLLHIWLEASPGYALLAITRQRERHTFHSAWAAQFVSSFL